MRNILKVLSVITAPIMFVCTLISGCSLFNRRPVDGGVKTEGIMRDLEKAPEQNAAYENYSKQALADYRAVAAAYADDDGETDYDNEEVIKAASTAAAKLFAYACYNERTLDQYVFFADQTGKTDLGSTGKAEARKQEYYLRVNENPKSCGYRYHYTIKKVTNHSGTTMATAKGFFESARIRLTDKTNLLYRFEGKTSTLKLSEENHDTLGCPMLTCDWETGSDWGKPDIQMVKSDFINPEDIKADIEEHAGEDNITIRGNINILAENIVKSATIIDNDDGVTVMMEINTEVANTDEASLKMLRKANSSDDCVWVGESQDGIGLTISFRLWNNGLFRFYYVHEQWSGTIKAGPLSFEGSADSETTYKYSYSDTDCDMTENLKLLETKD